MGSHPLNLFVRFLLEISALISTGIWGWSQGEGWSRYLLVIGIPLILAAFWGVFAVPNDPSRSGKAPVATSGFVRLVIELGFFAFATWTLYNQGYEKAGQFFGSIVAVHYLISYDRIRWLLSR